MDFTSSHSWQRESGVELIKNRIELASICGCDNVVLHIDIHDGDLRDDASRDDFFAPVFASFDELRPICVETGVSIAIENLFGRAGARSWLDTFGILFERYHSDTLGLCYDSGHWELVEPFGIQILDSFGERLAATHLHDNWGVQDDHLLPGDGRLDWDKILRGIAETPYALPLNYETPKDKYRLSSEAYYARAHSIAEAQAKTVEELRRLN